MTSLADLPDDIDALKAIIVAMDDRNQRLGKLVEAFRHAIFGRKSEKTDPNQYELALEGEPLSRHWSERQWRTRPELLPSRQRKRPAT